MIIRTAVCVMIVVIRPTSVANNRASHVIRTEVDMVLFVYAKIAVLLTTVYLVVPYQ